MNSFSNWQLLNEKYLAAALSWLRLRLTWQIERLDAPAGQSALQQAQEASEARVAQAAAQMAAIVAEMELPPALGQLSQRFRLAPFEENLLLLCAAMEFDTGVAALCARAQDNATRPYPTFALALSLFEGAAWDALSPQRPLRYWKQIEVNKLRDQPLTSSPLQVDERIVNYIKGLNYLDERLVPLLDPLEVTEARISDSQQSYVNRIVQHVQQTAPTKGWPIVQLLGADQDSKQLVAWHAGNALGRHLYHLSAELLPSQPPELEAVARLWQRETMLMRVALYLDAYEVEDNPTIDAAASPLNRFLTRSGGLIFLDSYDVRTRVKRATLELDVKKPTPPATHFSSPVQFKLTVNAPNDQYEQEADAVADAVMRMPASSSPSPIDDLAYPSPTSRFGTPSSFSTHDTFDQVPTPLPPHYWGGLRGGDISRIQSKGDEGGFDISPDVEGRISNMQGGGSPLPDEDRTFFEDRMGADFSGVRVHTDSGAAQTSRDLSARAFTVGNNIAFNSGEYQPGTDEGRRLLAHELTHTMQQGASGQRVSRQAVENEPDAASSGAASNEQADKTAETPNQAAKGEQNQGAEAKGDAKKDASAAAKGKDQKAAPAGAKDSEQREPSDVGEGLGALADLYSESEPMGGIEGIQSIGEEIQNVLPEPFAIMNETIRPTSPFSTPSMPMRNELELRNESSQTWQGLQKQASTLQSETANKVNASKQDLQGQWSGLQQKATQSISNLKQQATGAWQELKGMATGLWENLKGLATDAEETLKGMAEQALQKLQDMAKEFLNDLMSQVTEALGSFSDLASDSKSKFEDLGKQALEKLKSMAMEALNDLKEQALQALMQQLTKSTGFFGQQTAETGVAMATATAKSAPAAPFLPAQVAAMLANLMQTAMQAFTKLMQKAMQSLQELKQKGVETWNKLKNFGETAKSMLEQIAMKAIEKLKSVATQALQKLQQMGTQALDNLKNLGTQAFNKLKDLGTQALNDLKSIGTEALNSLKSIGTQAWNDLKSMGQNLLGSVQQTFSQIQSGWSQLEGMVNNTFGQVQQFTQGASQQVQQLSSQVQSQIENKATQSQNKINPLQPAWQQAEQFLQGKINELANTLFGQGATSGQSAGNTGGAAQSPAAQGGGGGASAAGAGTQAPAAGNQMSNQVAPPSNTEESSPVTDESSPEAATPTNLGEQEELEPTASLPATEEASQAITEGTPEAPSNEAESAEGQEMAAEASTNEVAAGADESAPAAADESPAAEGTSEAANEANTGGAEQNSDAQAPPAPEEAAQAPTAATEEATNQTNTGAPEEAAPAIAADGNFLAAPAGGNSNPPHSRHWRGGRRQSSHDSASRAHSSDWRGNTSV